MRQGPAVGGSRDERRLLDEALAHGEGGGFGPVVGAELAEHVGDVRLDGTQPDEERVGDLPVRLTLGQQPEDVEFAAREPEGRRGAGAIGGNMIGNAQDQRNAQRYYNSGPYYRSPYYRY